MLSGQSPRLCDDSNVRGSLAPWHGESLAEYRDLKGGDEIEKRNWEVVC